MASLTARSLDLQLGDWRDADTAAYTALADRIRLLILDGRIALGTRLPAERDLATHLELSRTTVTSAYGELRDAGFLASVRGSGSVTRLPFRPSTSFEQHDTGYLDFTKAALPATPELAGAAVRAAERLPAFLGDSGFDPIGLRELREAIAERYTARGLPTEAEQIMVTTGAQHAIALLARTLLARGDHALVEMPGYPHSYDALRVAGARLLPVSVTTDDGWDDLGLEQALQRSSPSIGYLMPDFHNPTGRTMSAETRERALALAARSGTTLIADETMAELGIDDIDPMLPFGCYAPPESATNVVHVGSVGKSVWGGVRVGWIRAERSLIQRLVRNRSAGDLGTPVLEQLIVTDLLGRYDGVLAGRRAQLRAGRDHLSARLAERLPEWHVPSAGGGLTAWVGLGAPVSSQLTLAARNEGLLIAAGPRFGIEGTLERFLRVPFSYPPAEIDRAVDALAAAWQTVARHPLPEPGYLAGVV